MSKNKTHRTDAPPRDGKRTHRAKQRTQARKQQRAVKALNRSAG